MKKLLSIALCIILLAIISVSTTTVLADDITVEIDGNMIDFGVEPQIIDGRTMVPLRKIFEEIGALVKWDGETQTVSARKNSKTVTLTVNSAELKLDKGDTDEEGNPLYERIQLEVPMQIVSGRTLVPARAIAESFGLNVNWNEEKQRVIITSDDEEDESWKENTGTINLSNLTYDGNGIEISGNEIKITSGGDFTVKGTLADGNITVLTKEKVKLRLNNASIKSSNNPCIFIENADKAYITLADGTKNYLVAENSEDGAIYSKENLEIKGNGTLEIESKAGHAIKASDNLTIENGILNMNASGDGIHINDTFKMTGGKVTITAIGDGIDSESIVNISGGSINIETNGVPIETVSTDVKEETQLTQTNQHRGWLGEESADIEFEKSSKGINAEWMMCISNGEINVNSASHAIHCEDEIEITGGKFNLSSKFEKGISAHENLTISNPDTIIDVVKSTEGIESKNVMTINDGVITVVSTDDALNATGGNSGALPGMGQGGMRESFEKIEIPEDVEGTTDVILPEIPMNNRGQKPNRLPRMQSGEATDMPENTEMPVRGERKDMPVLQRHEENKGMVGENRGGIGRNMKDCLIINGGKIELYGGDDCLDANGNIIINGGTVKAVKSNGTFSGAEGIIDPDGRVTISENAELIFAGGRGNERGLSLTQNNIIVNCDSVHTPQEMIVVKEQSGDVMFRYEPLGNFSTVLIASDKLKTGETYIIEVGNESHTVVIEEKSTIIGAQKNGFTGKNRFIQ